ncbi:unnamed protein product [Tilletia controversa]|nr:unnamed protein product [Tilletia controversa]
MSGSMRASVLKSRIARLPHLPAIHPEGQGASESSSEAQEGSDDNRQQSTMGPPPSLGQPRKAKNSAPGAFSPISAGDCFEQALEIDVQFPEGASSTNATFRVYYTPPRVKSVAKEQKSSYSGLSYALAAREITRLTKGQAGVLSLDCRGHGRTRVEPSGSSTDMSLATLSSDLILVLQTMFGADAPWPKLLFVGHSMGGSVVTKAVEKLLSVSSSIPRTSPPVSITGLAVLDVVEGTALDALDGMTAIVKAQPTGFASVEDAIRWHVDGGVLMNVESARRSVPSLLIPNPAFRESDSSLTDEEGEEEEVMQEDGTGTDSSTFIGEQPKLKWKADLLATAPFWRGWFEGMSQRFLTSRTARLLLLAGTDRLDKDLMIGQMQGKYQLVVFPEVGHCLHEDAPERTAQVLVDFWRRNQQSVVPIAKLRQQHQQART